MTEGGIDVRESDEEDATLLCDISTKKNPWFCESVLKKGSCAGLSSGQLRVIMGSAKKSGCYRSMTAMPGTSRRERGLYHATVILPPFLVI